MIIEVIDCFLLGEDLSLVRAPLQGTFLCEGLFAHKGMTFVTPLELLLFFILLLDLILLFCHLQQLLYIKVSHDLLDWDHGVFLGEAVENFNQPVIVKVLASGLVFHHDLNRHQGEELLRV